jgi:hypothetical protein
MASTVTAMPSKRMSEAEWHTRLDLAACYRLVDVVCGPSQERVPATRLRREATLRPPDDNSSIRPRAAFALAYSLLWLTEAALRLSVSAGG